MSYLGSWKINDIIDIPGITHTPATAETTDADSDPTWRIYKTGTTAPIRTGTLSKRDSQTGFYTDQESLSAANGYVEGFHYLVKIIGVVGGVSGGIDHNFQIGPEGATASALSTHDGKLDGAIVSIDAILANTRILSFRKDTALSNVQFAIRDANGDPVPGESVAAQRILDGGSVESMDNLVAEVGSTGVYRIDYSADDVNCDFGSHIFTPNSGKARVINFMTVL